MATESDRTASSLGRWCAVTAIVSTRHSAELVVPPLGHRRPRPRLERRPREMLRVKKYASCFFGTDMAARLVTRQVDTLIITGCTTSGCVRASAVDACSLGLHTIVVQEAVGDRAELPHIANLFDIDAKYGDVVDLQDALGYLERLPGRVAVSA